MTTKSEREWMTAIAGLGCIVCRLQGRGYVPAAVHHLLTDGGRRRGHHYTIPLCAPGHHAGAPAESGEVSRHPNKAAFEDRYGTEDYLLQHTRAMVARLREIEGGR